MAVDSSSITALYTSLADAVETRYSDMYTAHQIDAETYAKLLSQTSSSLMELAVATVQKQEMLDIDKDKAKNVAEAELEKQWGYKVTRNSNGEVILGATTGKGKVDKEYELLATQQETANYQLVNLMPVEFSKKKSELIAFVANAQANLEKVWGYTVGLSSDLTAISSVVDNGTGKVDLEVDILEAQKNITYTDRIIKDKQAVMLGLDTQLKTVNTAPEATYTPKYKEVV